jgi:hypothetical protein
MLQISRKLFAIPINQVYFQELKNDSRYEPKIIRYTHLLKPSRQLQSQQTIHIDLRQEEGTLLNRISDKVISLMEDIQVEKWNISRLDHPTNQEIYQFQQFYNLYAKQKKVRKLNKFDIQTLQLLRDKGGLVITKLMNEKNETLWFRIYVVSDEIVMALYNDGQDLLNTKKYQCADYFLSRENMKYFKKAGYKIYDFGNIRDTTILEDLMKDYGGEIVTVYSGYISKSFLSQMLVQLNFKLLERKPSI